MPRGLIATAAGIAFVLAYVAAAIALPDHLPAMAWPVAFLYWAAAGLLWVIPVRWLMLWGAGRR